MGFFSLEKWGQGKVLAMKAGHNKLGGSFDMGA